MEACFSQLTLDVIGKAVFNYDFNALTTDSPLIQVGQLREWVALCAYVDWSCLVTHEAGRTATDRKSSALDPQSPNLPSCDPPVEGRGHISRIDCSFSKTRQWV